MLPFYIKNIRCLEGKLGNTFIYHKNASPDSRDYNKLLIQLKTLAIDYIQRPAHASMLCLSFKFVLPYVFFRFKIEIYKSTYELPQSSFLKLFKHSNNHRNQVIKLNT